MSEQLSYNSSNPSPEEIKQGPLSPSEQLSVMLGQNKAESIIRTIESGRSYIKDCTSYEDPQTVYEQTVERDIIGQIGWAGGIDLSQKMERGEITPTDLYDETGALTLPGRIAMGYVEYTYNPQSQEGPDSYATQFLDALNKGRLNDPDIAREAALAEKNLREKEASAKYVADTASHPSFPRPGYNINTTTGELEKNPIHPDIEVIYDAIKDDLRTSTHPAANLTDISEVSSKAYLAANQESWDRRSGIKGTIGRLKDRVAGRTPDHPDSHSKKTAGFVSNEEFVKEAREIAHRTGVEANKSGDLAAQQAPAKLAAEKAALEEQQRVDIPKVI